MTASGFCLAHAHDATARLMWYEARKLLPGIVTPAAAVQGDQAGTAAAGQQELDSMAKELGYSKME